ncbi:hypothetical protein Pryu01_02429 [Paraliobacillus ryukyuensis]|uniref:Uncharacterized protein DUF4935 n=1 Tax=Paraliobacillus ryukyuensis TaxID=200904 RepID=A0A366DWD4_9BACI|nr:PIN domain-containing protein [Paraliobacillus ryukyuensis]RBO93584.1 uncharacterized protein DUF4935 [Paraliobacillus ryukyuensis]
MNIFLDSNILYKDPFLKSIHNDILVNLAWLGEIKLYMSEVVYEEVINNYKKQLNEIYHSINLEHNKIKTLVANKYEEQLYIDKSVEVHCNALLSFYNNMFFHNVIRLVRYSNDLLPELVNRSIKREKPFSNNKQEFRDAIIWLSYVSYAKENLLEECHLITNNKHDFQGDNGELHDDLKKDAETFKLYNSTKQFFSLNKKLITIQKSMELQNWIQDENLTERYDMLQDLIEENALNSLFNSCSMFLERYTSKDLFSDDKEEPFETTDITFDTIEVTNYDIIDDSIIINGVLSLFIHIDLYEFESYFLNEPKTLTGHGTIKLKTSFTLDIGKGYKFNNFDLDDISIIS